MTIIYLILVMLTTMSIQSEKIELNYSVSSNNKYKTSSTRMSSRSGGLNVTNDENEPIVNEPIVNEPIVNEPIVIENVELPQINDNEILIKREINPKYYSLDDYKNICVFQANSNLVVDRTAGDDTKLWFDKNIITNVDIIPKGFEDKDLIIINKDTKILTFYRNGKIEGKYGVALGKSGYATPSGKRRVTQKIVNPAWGGINGKYTPVRGGAPNNPLGKFWIGIGGLYGVHGTNNEKSIGTYSSSGCIRMYSDDVKVLFEKVNKGTEVWIGNNELLKKWGVKQGSL